MNSRDICSANPSRERSSKQDFFRARAKGGFDASSSTTLVGRKNVKLAVPGCRSGQVSVHLRTWSRYCRADAKFGASDIARGGLPRADTGLRVGHLVFWSTFVSLANSSSSALALAYERNSWLNHRGKSIKGGGRGAQRSRNSYRTFKLEIRTQTAPTVI